MTVMGSHQNFIIRYNLKWTNFGNLIFFYVDCTLKRKITQKCLECWSNIIQVHCVAYKNDNILTLDSVGVENIKLQKK